MLEKDKTIEPRLTPVASPQSPTGNPAGVVYLDDLLEKWYVGYERLYKPGRNQNDADALSTLNGLKIPSRRTV